MSYEYKKGKLPDFMPPVKIDFVEEQPGLTPGIYPYEIVDAKKQMEWTKKEEFHGYQY